MQRKKVFTTSAITIKTNLIAMAVHFIAKTYHTICTSSRKTWIQFTLEMRGVFKINVETIIYNFSNTICIPKQFLEKSFLLQKYLSQKVQIALDIFKSFAQHIGITVFAKENFYNILISCHFLVISIGIAFKF